MGLCCAKLCMPDMFADPRQQQYTLQQDGWAGGGGAYQPPQQQHFFGLQPQQQQQQQQRTPEQLEKDNLERAIRRKQAQAYAQVWRKTGPDTFEDAGYAPVFTNSWDPEDDLYTEVQVRKGNSQFRQWLPQKVPLYKYTSSREIDGGFDSLVWHRRFGKLSNGEFTWVDDNPLPLKRPIPQGDLLDHLEDQPVPQQQAPQQQGGMGGLAAFGQFTGGRQGLGGLLSSMQDGTFAKNVQSMAANQQRIAAESFKNGAQVYVKAWKAIGPSMFQSIGYAPIFENRADDFYVEVWQELRPGMYSKLQQRIPLYGYSDLSQLVGDMEVVVEAWISSGSAYVSFGRIALPRVRPLQDDEIRPFAATAAIGSGGDPEEQNTSQDPSSPLLHQ